MVNKQNYSLLQSSLKIDDLVDPRLTTVSTILKHVHKGTIETVYTLLDGEYEFIEAEILETSELISKSIKDSNLPKEIRIGAVVRDKNVIIPNGYSLNIEPGTTFRLKENISLFAKGDLNAVGNKDHPIVFTAADPLKPFGALAIIGRDKPVNVQMKHLNVNGGSEATIEGIRFLGQLSIHNSNFPADSITLENSFSDDGGNIRNSQVEITKSSFINNQFDQLLDSELFIRYRHILPICLYVRIIDQLFLL